MKFIDLILYECNDDFARFYKFIKCIQFILFCSFYRKKERQKDINEERQRERKKERRKKKSKKDRMIKNNLR